MARIQGTFLAVSLILISPVILAQESTEAPPAEDVIVISASRNQQLRDHVGSSVTVITRSDWERHNYTELKEALTLVPGLDIINSGTGGGISSVFLRGGKSEHTLVLIDGVEVSNPGSPSRTFEFAQLNLVDIERIEVLRGPQSVLYGAKAMGGVIYITTRKGAPQASSTTYQLLAGSHETVDQSLVFNQKFDPWFLRLELAHNQETSPSLSREGDDHDEKDRHIVGTASGIVGYAQGPLRWELGHRYEQSYSDIDTYGGLGGDDPNYTGKDFNQLTHTTLAYAITPDWNSQLTLSVGHYRQFYNDLTDAAHPMDSFFGRYLAERQDHTWENTIRISDQHTLLAGINWKKELADIYSESSSSFGSSVQTMPEKSEEVSGIFAEEQWLIMPDLQLTLGGRHDTNDSFGEHNTYRSTLRYTMNPLLTIWRASYGTGFNAPSIQQLYWAYGNPQLEAETSRGWDFGFEQPVAEQWRFGCTYFRNHYNNLIDFDFATSQYANIGEAETYGTENFLRWRQQAWSSQLQYIYLRAKNLTTGQVLLRRPHQRVLWDVAWQHAAWQHAIAAQWVDDRADIGTTLDAYAVYNYALNYKLNDHMTVLMKVDNLSNKTYEEISGYNTYGRSYYAGARVTF